MLQPASCADHPLTDIADTIRASLGLG
jgi:hypothetical protein